MSCKGPNGSSSPRVAKLDSLPSFLHSLTIKDIVDPGRDCPTKFGSDASNELSLEVMREMLLAGWSPIQPYVYERGNRRSNLP